MTRVAKQIMYFTPCVYSNMLPLNIKRSKTGARGSHAALLQWLTSRLITNRRAREDDSIYGVRAKMIHMHACVLLRLLLLLLLLLLLRWLLAILCLGVMFIFSLLWWVGG